MVEIECPSGPTRTSFRAPYCMPYIFWAGTCLEAFDPAALIAESWEMALNWRAQEGQARRLATRINDVTKDNGTCLQGTRGPVTCAQ